MALCSLFRVRRALAPLIACVLLLGLSASAAEAVTMRTTNFVAKFEGFLSCPYNDPAGHATIGYGHLLHYGGVTKKDKREWGCITKKEALKLLRKDLRESEDALMAKIEGATVSPSMVTALTSFVFNLGSGILDPRRGQGQPRRTAIARSVVNGRYRRAAKDMLLYDGVIMNGKRYELKGLQIRRRKESRLMIKGIGEIQTCSKNCAPEETPGGTGNTGGTGGLTP